MALSNNDDLDTGISYRASTPNLQKLLDKVKARKRAAGEGTSDRNGMIMNYRAMSSKLDELIEFAWNVPLKGGGIRIYPRKGVKSIGNSPLGLAVRKKQNALMAYRNLTPHIEDIAEQLKKFRFSSNPDDLIEFKSILSIGTAKKVLRDIRTSNKGLSVIRPTAPLGGVAGALGGAMAAYVPKTTSRASLATVESMYGVKKLKPHTILAPRVSAKERESMLTLPPGTMKLIPAKLRKAAKRGLANLGGIIRDPLAIAAHEHGHVNIPTATSKRLEAQVSGRGIFQQPTRRIAASRIKEEYRANRVIRDKIAQYGSPQEVQAWRKFGQKQIKVGYRAPMFGAALAATGTPAEMKKAQKTFKGSLSWGKRALRAWPEVRKQELSALINGLIQFQGDPRPRNNLGEFSPREEGGPDPNAMVKTYRIAPAQPGMAPNKNQGPSLAGIAGLGLVGGAAGATGAEAAKGGGRALQALARRLGYIK